MRLGLVWMVLEAAQYQWAEMWVIQMAKTIR
jgi:hypothetical protein